MLKAAFLPIGGELKSVSSMRIVDAEGELMVYAKCDTDEEAAFGSLMEVSAVAAKLLKAGDFKDSGAWLIAKIKTQRRSANE